MTPPVAIALCVFLSMSGASLAAESQAPSEAPTHEGAADQATEPAASPEAEDVNPATGRTDTDDKAHPPIDVHRHRPGACPEGPPCKSED